MIRVFATDQGLVVEAEGCYRRAPRAIGFDAIFTSYDPSRLVLGAVASAPQVSAPDEASLRSPIENQEVWAAGVTYLRSRTARMEEAMSAGAAEGYDRVKEAQRPEICIT